MTLHPPEPFLTDITRPTLLLDEVKVRRNIARMAHRAQEAGLIFRPHFKTHQSATLGQWFSEQGVEAITVSSVDMAQYFARHGWRDITVAFPVNPRQLARIDALAGQIELGLLVDAPVAVKALAAFLTNPVRVWVEVDTGYGRTGFWWKRALDVVAVVKTIASSSRLTFAGLLSHTGQTYQATSRDEIVSMHRQAVTRLLTLKEAVIAAGLGPCPISLGDTPACSVITDWSGVDEIRPGNFVFNDLMQFRAGACRARDIAIAVACPVVGSYIERGQVVIYGGAVHLGLDFIRDATGRRLYGYAAAWEGNAWGGPELKAPLVSLSQEHGILSVADFLLTDVEVGQLVVILPAHSCLTADLYGEYRTLGNNRLNRLQSNADPDREE